jgi:hypothetical protein
MVTSLTHLVDGSWNIDHWSTHSLPSRDRPYPGAMVELPDGTLVEIRPQSSSGGATIDVSQGGTQYKVHISP